jgi:hypothetical protein
MLNKKNKKKTDLLGNYYHSNANKGLDTRLSFANTLHKSLKILPNNKWHTKCKA